MFVLSVAQCLRETESPHTATSVGHLILETYLTGVVLQLNKVTGQDGKDLVNELGGCNHFVVTVVVHMI